MTVTVDRLREDGVLGPLQEAFAQMIARLDARGDGRVALAAALVSRQVDRGHVCLDLNELPAMVFSKSEDFEAGVRYEDWPELSPWQDRLAASPCVSCRDADDAAKDVDRPLVLDTAHARLYLGRYWYYQQRLAHDIARRVVSAPLVLDESRLHADIARLFPHRDQPSDFDQCVAAANAVDCKFSVITGGPGTGKTTTVAKLIALRLLQQFHAEHDQPLRVLLMAPTGKAAQRLNESLGRAAARLDVDDKIRHHLQAIQAGTIHRLLRWTPLAPERGGPFVHDEEFPLEADVVLVDEASMVDIGLMWRLFSAVPDSAQVILMGDRDQLASIEAGGVLADLCGDSGAAPIQGTSPERRKVLEHRTGLQLSSTAIATHPLDPAVVSLRYSHRFDPASGLGKMAAAIRAGRADEVIDQLKAADDPNIVWLRGESQQETFDHMVRLAEQHYAPYLKLLRECPAGRLDVLKTLLQFRVLCAHREGRWGELRVDRAVAEALDGSGLIRWQRRAYLGQAVMVTKNDYRQNLFNGDIGVVVRDDSTDGLAVLFENAASSDGCRRVPAALIPEHRSCYAMTIHKSQGSEFHRVMIVLPPVVSPVLTRELLYTGITRVADTHDPQTGQRQPGTLYIIGAEDVLRAAIERRIQRSSGLRQAIERSAKADDGR